MKDQPLKPKKVIVYCALILLVACLAMLPVALMWHPLKYDLIDQAYPWKYFIGECLQEGILPLWNPYQLLGSPIHADPQSSAWYPVTWFFGYLFGYNIYIISVDFMLHIFLAGMGMFYLGRQLKFSAGTSFFMAVSYMLSGFFIGNAQHFMWIISGTWIPFILGAFLALKDKPSTEAAVRFGLASFMILTGGYPAFVFLMAYLLTAMFILFAAGYFRKKDYPGLYRFAGYSALAVGISALMASVVLISVYHLPEAMTRGEGVTLKQALFGAFTLKSMVSFLLPYASVREMEVFGTDMSMSNGYFGLIPLIFFFAALFFKKDKVIVLFLAWGLFCLLASAGDATPLRRWLFEVVPFMDQFRFPALFRIYAILSFIVVAGSGFEKMIGEGLEVEVDPGRRRKILLLSVAAVLVVLIGLIIFSLSSDGLRFGEFLREDLFIFSERSTIAQHILFQGIIQLTVLGFFVLIILRMRRMRHLLSAILILVCLDLIIASRLNGPYTVFYHQYESKDIFNHSKQFPKGFPMPGNTKLIDNKDQEKGMMYQALWRNLNIFYKEVSFEGYNPLHLKGFEEMADNHPETFAAMLGNPLVFQAASPNPLDEMSTNEAKGHFDPGSVYLDASDYLKLHGQGLSLSPGDQIWITGFTPIKVTAKSVSRGNVLVSFQQNRYHGWKATVDGNPAEIITVNMSFMAVVVPAGEHEVIFYYNPRAVRWGFYITLLMLVAGMVILRGDPPRVITLGGL